MDVMLVIRKSAERDVPAISEIETSSFEEPWSRDEISRSAAAGGMYTAVFDEGKPGIAGFAEFKTVAGEAQIYRIAVAPALRSRGIGEALMRYILGKAAEEGCTIATLEVEDGNTAAISLYKKLGFRETGRRPAYYKDKDAVLMDLYL